MLHETRVLVAVANVGLCDCVRAVTRLLRVFIDDPHLKLGFGRQSPRYSVVGGSLPRSLVFGSGGGHGLAC